jgi:hypothetical protein
MGWICGLFYGTCIGWNICVVHIVHCLSNELNLISGLTWLMVYRTEKYQKLKAEVERQSKRCKCICEM